MGRLAVHAQPTYGLAFLAIFSGVATSTLLFFATHPVHLPADKPEANPALGETAMQLVLTQRVCGSPAVDGYTHVKPECLEASPTNQWWQRAKPGPAELEAHYEEHADYDGLAVQWGIGNSKKSLQDCAQACKDYVPTGNGPFGNLPCNTFSWCGGAYCWEPDVHKHSVLDCWLKFTEAPAAPEVNMRGNVSAAQRARHPGAPELVPWHSGVLLPRGVVLTNGSWSPRSQW